MQNGCATGINMSPHGILCNRINILLFVISYASCFFYNNNKNECASFLSLLYCGIIRMS